jgi:hypothetical protein
MPLRINEITSNVQVSGQETQLSENEINRVVNIVLQKFREEQEHQARVMAETTIRDGVSELEPY